MYSIQDLFEDDATIKIDLIADHFGISLSETRNVARELGLGSTVTLSEAEELADALEELRGDDDADDDEADDDDDGDVDEDDDAEDADEADVGEEADEDETDELDHDALDDDELDDDELDDDE